MKSIYVLSDLHLAPEGALNSFHQGEALVALIASLPHDACLVLAGDTFDLLQVEGRAERLDWVGAASLLREALSQVAARDWGQNLLRALSAFVGGGGQCVVLPGNHDIELYHPACETVLCEALGLQSGCPLTVHRQAEPLRLPAGPREVIIGHGHRGDAWNDVDPATIHAALSAGATGQDLPPGSTLVLNTLNAFKHAVDPLSGRPRFPFVDRLKPEMPGVALLLLYLDPSLACRHLPGVLGPLGQTLVRSLRRRLFGGPSLGGPAAGTPPSAVEDLAVALAEGLDQGEQAAPEATLRELELGLQGKHGVAGPGTLAAHRGRLRWVLRAAVRRLSYDHSFFRRGATSRIDQAILDTLLPKQAEHRVVIAGHTHAAREVRLSDDRVYLNTGTWSDLLSFPEDAQDKSLSDWIDRLEANTLKVVPQRTYAVVDADGARLLDWT
jgi:UDP-2,3-diacylglucosamine pyrophosphatase LpxH